MRYEYRVVPAPERGEKVKGVKAAEGRFAAAVERIMNDMAALGWEYQRSDTLPSEERAGLTGTQTVWRNLLVFRRPAAQDAGLFEPRMLEPPLAPSQPAQTARDAPVAQPAAYGMGDGDVQDALLPHPAAEEEDAESGATVIGLPDALRARAARLRTSN